MQGRTLFPGPYMAHPDGRSNRRRWNIVGPGLDGRTTDFHHALSTQDTANRAYAAGYRAAMADYVNDKIRALAPASRAGG